MNKLKKPGLGQVLKDVCGVDTNKGLASSDWRRRPLPQSQLFYCVLDVVFLQHIASSLVDLLLDTPAAVATGAEASSGAVAPHAADAEPCVPAGAASGSEAAAGSPSARTGMHGGGPSGGDGVAGAVGDGNVGEGGDGLRVENGTGGGGGAEGQSAGPGAAAGDTAGGVRLAAAWKRSQKLALTLYKPGAARATYAWV